MNIREKLPVGDYKAYVQKTMPKSKTVSECFRAFLVGGLICTFGQALRLLGTEVLKLSDKHAGAFTSIVLVFLGALFTGLGVYDVLGKFAGAGSIVPISGFANSIVAPALEYKREGYILGVGAKLFTVAGPVLTYGISASVVIGFIYWILLQFGVAI